MVASLFITCNNESHHACSHIHSLWSGLLLFSIIQCIHLSKSSIWASKSKIFALWSAAEVSGRCVLSWWSMSRCQNVTSHHAVTSHDTVMHTVMQSYCHGVMGRDSAAPCSDVPKQSGAIAHPLSQLVMDQGTFGHRDTYLSLTIDSACKGHIDIIMNIL